MKLCCDKCGTQITRPHVCTIKGVKLHGGVFLLCSKCIKDLVTWLDTDPSKEQVE